MAKVLSANKKPRRNRPELKTKEELINYINDNPETEVPFLEELWETSVIQAKKDEDNGQSIVDISITDNNGTITKQKKGAKFWSNNPVKWYLKQCGLPQWRKKSVAILESRESKTFENEHQQKIVSNAFDDDEDEIYGDEVISWINLFKPDEKFFLKKRYVHYYDCYEINEGADKGTLKGLLSLEIALHRIDTKRALSQSVNIIEEEKLRKSFREAFESLKWTKKQRNARDDMAQNKFTVWIQDVSKEEHFKHQEKHYPKDEIDFLLETYISSAREMMM